MYTVTKNSHRQHMADDIRTADTSTVSVETTKERDGNMTVSVSGHY